MDKYQRDVEQIKTIADKYNIQIDELAGNIIIARTIYGSWRFDITDKPYDLYHRPIFMWNYNESIKYNDGYHRQNKFFTDFEDLLNYIYRHDIKAHKHPGPKKSIPSPAKKKNDQGISRKKKNFHSKKKKKI